MSPDNSLRSAAEKSLESEWREELRVGPFLIFLAQTAANGADDVTKSFSAVLLRRTAIRSPKACNRISDRTIGVLDEESKKTIRSILLQGFATDQSPQVRRKISDAISEVAREDGSPSGTWPDLVPAIMQAATNPSSSFRECAYRILSSSPEIIEKDMVDNVLPIFEAGFADEDHEVRIIACTAFVSFFRDLPKNSWQSLTPLLPSLLNSLPRFLESGLDEALSNVLQSLIDLVELAPKMFKDMFPTIIEFCSGVAKNKQLESRTRLPALELLTTFSETSPVMCRQTSGYTTSMVLVNLLMLTEVSLDDDDAVEWNNDDNSDDYDDEPEYDAARQSLDRVALKLGGRALAEPLFQYLPAMIQSNDWRECFAALMALSSAAEGCQDVLITEISRLLDMVLPTLNHEHSRVQYACCNALGQMSTDFADIIQRSSGDRILPALISKLTSKSVPRVQAHAAAALVNFSEAATKEVLEPYLDTLLSNLLGLLDSPKRYVQEQVLTTIATIADAAGQKFIKYQDTLLPMLIEFLKSDLGPENRMLTAKCIECATLIAVAVGRENFAPHSQALISAMGVLQESTGVVDDPVKQYLDEGWGRICKLSGKDFLAYLPAVLPPLMATAKAAQDISFLEEDEIEEFSKNDEWDVISISGKILAVHTAALDEKSSAINLLRIYATQLKGLFLPWVQEIVQDIALPALDFYLHDGVRSSASLALAALLKSTIDGTSNNSVETATIWSSICSKLVESITTDPVLEPLVAYYSTLVECIDSLEINTLSQEQLRAIAKALALNMTGIYERIKQRESDDDEFQEDVTDSEEEYTDEELFDEINKVITAVFRNSKSNFLNEYQQNLAPLVSTFISDENTSIQLCALCCLCELIEYCGNEFDQTTYLSYVVSECLSSPDASIRQASACAIGTAAQYGGPTYGQICIRAIPTLLHLSTFQEARSGDNMHATENCIAAIAKVCRSYNSSVPELDKVLVQWVAALPVVNDEEAATFVYDFLADLVQSEHPATQGQYPKIIDSVLQVLASQALNAETTQKIVAVTQALIRTIPHEKAVEIMRPYSNLAYVTKYFS